MYVNIAVLGETQPHERGTCEKTGSAPHEVS